MKEQEEHHLKKNLLAPSDTVIEKHIIFSRIISHGKKATI